MYTPIFTSARLAARQLIEADKNHLLSAIAQSLSLASDEIINANSLDIAGAKTIGTSDALIDRLKLGETRFKSILSSVADVIALPNPVSQVLEQWTHPKGMKIKKLTVPFGVIGVIYESRPNVTVDAAVLCIKAGSSVVLRGSANALNTNRAVVNAMRSGLQAAGCDPNAITLIDSPDRASVTAMLKARGYIDLLIPRGGGTLIKHVVENATVPVIETGTGVCHLYVHESAQIDQALAILLNGKTQRPGVCNALETLLVDEKIAPHFMPLAIQALRQAGVEIRGCPNTRQFDSEIRLAVAPEGDAPLDNVMPDYGFEFLDLVIAVKIVGGLNSALTHIERFGTRHSEVICATDLSAITQFCTHVDAAVVYANASSRFTDGYEFGFGAEIGISTQKMHARGPMGLREMVTYKYLVDGSGQIR